MTCSMACHQCSGVCSTAAPSRRAGGKSVLPVASVFPLASMATARQPDVPRSMPMLIDVSKTIFAACQDVFSNSYNNGRKSYQLYGGGAEACC